MKRVLTALLLIVPTLYTIFAGPWWLFFAVVGTVATLCYREFARLAASHGLMTPWFGYAAGSVLLFLPGQEWAALSLLGVGALIWSLRAEDLARSLPSAGALLLGVVYVYGAWWCALRLREASPYWLFFALSVNWVGDVVAFYVGRTVGRRRLAPRVSPAKSWEGAIGSLLVAAMVGALFLHWLFALPIWKTALIAMAANVAGQCGDLAESGMKRGAGLKDSGTMLPGHGGWLDRLDSSLFSLPVTYAMFGLL